MLSDVTDFVNSCLGCGFLKPSNKKYGLLYPESDFSLFSNLSVDWSYIYKRGVFSYCLAISDKFSKLTHYYACKSTSAKELIVHLKDYFSRYGVPKELHFDISGASGSHALNEFLQEMGVSIKKAASHAHFSIGLSEKACGKFVSGLKFIVRKDKDRRKNWHKYIRFLTFHINNSPQAVTKLSAHDIVYGCNLVTPVMNKSVLLKGEPWNSRMGVLNKIRELAIKKQALARDAYKAAYDKNRIPIDFREGELVFVMFERKSTIEWPAKLQSRYRLGKIIKRISSIMFKVRFKNVNLPGHWVRLCHVAHFKKFTPRPGHLIENRIVSESSLSNPPILENLVFEQPPDVPLLSDSDSE